MIITVTFNPAIDKTAEVDVFCKGGLNRLTNVRVDAGGKGINVSKTIQALGGTTLCTGFLGGSNGEFIQDTLQRMGIAHDFVWVDGSTRVNLKVLDHDRDLTELNEEGPTLTTSDVEKLMDNILNQCDASTLVVLSGNVSPGVAKTIYYDMILKIKEKGASMILDADKELFAEGIKAQPMVIKPNTFELASYFNMQGEFSINDIIQKAKTLLHGDTKLIVISMGREGSIFLCKEGVYQANAVEIEAHSAVGAGDAMVGAIAYAIDQQMEIHDLIRLAVACSAGAVMSKGTNPAPREIVLGLMKYVTIEKVEDER